MGLLSPRDVYPGARGACCFMGSPLGALANLAETIVIKDGNVFLVPSVTAGCRRESIIRSASGSGIAAFSARTSCGICGQLPRLLTATDAAGTEAVHELTNPDLDLQRRGSLPAERCGSGWSARADAAGALRQRICRAELPPRADPAAARAAPRRGLPADARAARNRAESTSGRARRGPGRLLARRPRRRAASHARARHARRARPRTGARSCSTSTSTPGERST